MICLETFDVQSLPFVDIKNRKDLPCQPGIYFAIDSFNKVQYIGQSTHIGTRWSGHQKLDVLRTIEGIRIAYLIVLDCSLLDDIETALIRHFNPPLNKLRIGKSRQGKGIHVKTGRGLGCGVIKTVVVEVPNLGRRIKEARKMDSRSLKEICKAVGMTPMNWYRIEATEQSLPEGTLRKIEEVLGVDFGVSFENVA